MCVCAVAACQTGSPRTHKKHNHNIHAHRSAAPGELRRRVEGHEERLASLRACRKEYEELSETLRTLPDRTSHVSHPPQPPCLGTPHTLGCAVVGSRRSWCRSTAWG